MTNVLRFLIVLVLATACHKNIFMPANVDGECGCIEFPNDSVKSVYDVIAPAQFLVDSTEFYVQLNDALHLTNKWEWIGTPGYLLKLAEIDTAGNFTSLSGTDRQASKQQSLDDQVASLLGRWKPAYVLKDPSHKVSHMVYMSIRIHEDSILFSLQGPERRNLLRKNFKRPIIPIRKETEGEGLVDHNGWSIRTIDGIEYDTVAPAELTIDSTKFYRKVQRSLRFTNTIEWHGLIKGSETTFFVDSSGKFRPSEKYAAQDMEPGIDEVARTILRQAKHWKPAHLISRSGYTVPYDVIITIFVDEKNVRFRMYGEGDKDILKKYFRRPL
jgi:hypothetical protein